MRKIKVGIVNYLNTAPLVYGLENSEVSNRIELIGDYPSRLAADLAAGKIDAGLVPVAVIPELLNAHIIGDYCIGCDGEVASVCIFSEVPMEEVQTVLLDYQSRTSVELAKLLLRDYWKVRPRLITAAEGYQSQIGGSTAGLVIGDRSFEQRKSAAYVYDLGEAWKKHTGLPFVFAAWVSNSVLPEDFETAFNDANRFGIEHIQQVVDAHSGYTSFDLHYYYTSCISYRLDERKKQGMEMFLSLLKK